MKNSNPLKQIIFFSISCFLFITTTLSAQVNLHTPVFVDKLGKQGTNSGEFQNPTSIAVDNQGNIYVLDSKNKRIQKFAPDGTLDSNWSSGQLALDNPRDIAIDNQGNIYVANTDNHTIYKLAPNGKLITYWGGQGLDSGKFKNPNGIGIDNQGHIHVTDKGNNRIQKFDSNKNFLGKWGKHGGAPEQIEITQWQIENDSKYMHLDGTPGPHYESSGYCEHGSGNREFTSPGDIAIDKQGNIYVADTHNHRIQKFDSNMNFLDKWGKQGNGNGEFSEPTGIAVDNQGNIYVADAGNARIQKFDSSMKFLTKWGKRGNGNGEFSAPSKIAVDNQGNIYVADTDNHRIQKFSTSPIAELQGSWQEKANPSNRFQIKGSQFTDLTTNKTSTIKTYADAQLNQADPEGYYLATGQNNEVWEFIQKSGNELEIDPNPGQGALGTGGIIYIPYTPSNNQQAAGNNNNQAAKNKPQAAGNNNQHPLSGKTFHIKNTYGGSSHEWYGALLSWDNGQPHPMASVEKNDPVKWKFEAVSGKANTYKIVNTYPGAWKDASLSWDNRNPHPMISVEFNDPVEWRMDPVSGKANHYKIVSTHPGTWDGASISWDGSSSHPMASLEFNDPVEWELVPVK